MGDKMMAAHLVVVAKSTTSAALRRLAAAKTWKLPTSVHQFGLDPASQLFFRGDPQGFYREN